MARHGSSGLGAPLRQPPGRCRQRANTLLTAPSPARLPSRALSHLSQLSKTNDHPAERLELRPRPAPHTPPALALTRPRAPPLSTAPAQPAQGTYNPALRLLYIQDQAPGPAEFSATRMVFSVLPFVPRLRQLFAAAVLDGPALEPPPPDAEAEEERGGDGASTASTASDALAVSAEGSAGPSARDVLLWSAELGSWNFLGTGLQAWGALPVFFPLSQKLCPVLFPVPPSGHHPVRTSMNACYFSVCCCFSFHPTARPFAHLGSAREPPLCVDQRLCARHCRGHWREGQPVHMGGCGCALR